MKALQNFAFLQTPNITTLKTVVMLGVGVVTICTNSLTLNNSTFCPHRCIYVFRVDLRTNSDYFPIQH